MTRPGREAFDAGAEGRSATDAVLAWRAQLEEDLAAHAGE